ncbi:hypothetical protein DSCO28_65120 [Desulfosarcina ovata subsp. sediminis]|uniref:Lipoprotein n=1 Tax=Desulfosarcina ovata subsp. sediminis TaxID=885957 RepID=A0A5K8A0L5_9BACT|nr:tetratricopeptide repeat protein [Desulfosarcina ovata]BBO85946.1 hypothetical protein DSCO28_65120 [Desulfosarcina ovata subsp. sediminis]
MDALNHRAAAIVLCVLLLISSNAACNNTDTAEQTALALGYATPLLPVLDRHREALMQARGHLTAGRYQCAYDQLATLINEVPHYVEARFEYARTLVALGKDAESRAVLQRVLATDFTGYQQRVLAEPAFSRLRTPRFMADIRRLSEALARMLADGWPVLWWQPATPVDQQAEPPARQPFATLRTGVYVGGSKRFVPTGVPAKRLVAALSDWKSQTLLQVGAFATWDAAPILYDVTWQIGGWLAAEGPSDQHAPARGRYAFFRGIDFALTGDDVWLCPYEETMTPAPDAEPVGPVVLRVLPEGSILLHRAATVQWEGADLLIEGVRLTLPKDDAEADYRSVLRHMNGAFVVSNWHRCDASDPMVPAKAITRHRVDWVELDTARVTPLSTGRGAASVVQLPHGRVALQRGHRVDVIEANEKTLSNAMRLPEGLVLHVPLGDKLCTAH